MRKNKPLYSTAAALLAAALLVGCGSAPADSTPVASSSEAEASSESAVESTAESTSDAASDAYDLTKLFADNELTALLAKYDTVTTTTQYTYGGDDTDPITATAQYTMKDGRCISHGTSGQGTENSSVYATYADSEEIGLYLYSSADSKVINLYDSAESYDSTANSTFLPAAADIANMSVTNVSSQDGATLVETETVIDGARASTGIFYVDPETGNLLADIQTYYDGENVAAECLTNYDYTTAYEDADNLYGTLVNVDGGRKVTIISGADTGNETSRTLTVDADTLVSVLGSDDMALYADIEGKEPIYYVESGTQDATAYLLPVSAD